MTKNKVNTRNQQGFIAIVALGIFLILGVVGIIVQATTSRTTEQVRDTVSYQEAQDLADSVTEKLQLVLEQTGSGFILQPSVDEEVGADGGSEWDCNFGDYSENTSVVGPQDGSDDVAGGDVDLGVGGDAALADVVDVKDVDGICDALGNVIKGSAGKDDIRIDMQIKGRSEDGEKFTGGFEGLLVDKVYVVPFPGSGNAGKNCHLYEPAFGTAGVENDQNDVNQELIDQDGNPVDVPVLAHSCNWNKLSFGSSSTDRAAIPLYYAEVDAQGKTILTNPFSLDDNAKFILRVRTPCEPIRKCKDEDVEYSECAPGKKIEIPRYNCPSNGRFDLDDTEEDSVVLQWQISGMCGDEDPKEECGLIPGSGTIISESSIDSANSNFVKNMLLKYRPWAVTKVISTTTYEEISFGKSIKSFDVPTLSLMLTEHLISEDGERVPYLEYQLLSSETVGNPQVQIHVKVDVDGHIFEKDIFVEEEKELIDFAIHN